MVKKETKELTVDEKFEKLSSLEKKMKILNSELPDYAHSLHPTLLPDPLVRFLNENTGDGLTALKNYSAHLKVTANSLDSLISIFENKAIDIWSPEPGLLLVRGNESALDSAASQGLLRIETEEDFEEPNEFDEDDENEDNEF